MKPVTASRLSGILIAIGVVLAALSATDLCNFGGCTEAHLYRFFGIKLPVVGLVYFALLAASMLAARYFRAVGSLTPLILAGGAGAELTMIHLQKYVIKAWCPLCLGIAAVVYLLCILRMVQTLPESRRNSTMNRRLFLTKSVLVLIAAAIGFLTSFQGITPLEAAGPQAESALGRLNSKIDIYIFSDWLCPVCVRVEPAIEAALPTLEKKARIHFIDKPVHKEAMNFVPYHLSFLTYEKGKYLELRRALFALAKKTKTPTNDDVNGAIAPLGVTYRQLGFMEVSQTMAKFQALSDQYKVNATPTVVIANSASKKSKTLVGGTEITQENLLKTVKSLE